jgi:hypothetical protein
MPELVVHFSSGLDENGNHEGGSWIADNEELACRFAAKLIADRKVMRPGDLVYITLPGKAADSRLTTLDLGDAIDRAMRGDAALRKLGL